MTDAKNYSTSKKLYVWWHYHWKLLLIGLAALILLAAVILSQFQQKKPDYQIGLVSTEELPVDTAEALVEELKAYCEDVNGDGQILIQLNQYTVDFNAATENTDAYSQMSGVIKLSSDLSPSDGSYIFLFDDAESFEETTRALQYLDGSAPESDEEEVQLEKMYLNWTDCPVLTALSLGDYKGYTLMDDQTGSSQDVMSRFMIGRHIVSEEARTSTYAADEALWQALTAGAQ